VYGELVEANYFLNEFFQAKTGSARERFTEFALQLAARLGLPSSV
jgi:hypothetical protein